MLSQSAEKRCKWRCQLNYISVKNVILYNEYSLKRYSVASVATPRLSNLVLIVVNCVLLWW